MTTTYAASEKQLNFIRQLVRERVGSDETLLHRELTSREASDAITTLLKLPKHTISRFIAKDGMYRNPNDGEIYKVQFNKATGDAKHLYAKHLRVVSEAVRDEDNKIVVPAAVHFDYAPGMIALIEPEWKMTIEEAEAFGALYGTCCVCGRTLTNELSIALGIGPICRQYF